MTTYRSYGDDSADAECERVFAVAAVVAPEELWSRLEEAWGNINNNLPFHATDCDSDNGIYKERDHQQNKKLYRDCITLLTDSGAFGFAYAIDLAGREEFFPDTDKQLHYHWCYERVIRRIATFLGSRGISKVEFSFDNRLDIVSNAKTVYSLITSDEEFSYRQVLGERVEFLSSAKFPRIQLGDLYAREVMKHLDNMVGPRKREERKSFTALRNSGRFDVEFFMREAWQDKRRKFNDIQKHAGFTFDDYEKWLSRKCRTDNVSNRFEFLAWLDARDAKETNQT
jgi:hypothetical protein